MTTKVRVLTTDISFAKDMFEFFQGKGFKCRMISSKRPQYDFEMMALKEGEK